jgi:NhaP-type Na+/H+ or K+/H+ antiporter
MNLTLLVLFVVLIFAFGLVSRRLERTVVTAPILFTAFGCLTFVVMKALDSLPWLPSRESGAGFFLRVAEVGLVLLLFTDASRTDCQLLNSIRALPARLLSVGMLLTIGLGAAMAMVIFGHLTIWEAGILAAILAPTDAGLGQIIVNSPRVPVRIRQALNVEAGLNDGLSVPFLLFFFALAASGAEGGKASLMQFVVEQLGYGVLVGGGIGFAGGWLLKLAQRKEWMAESLQQLAVVTLPLLCLLVSEAVGASMFIAAFVAGLAVQAGFKEAGKHSVEFTDEWGQLLNLTVFFLFGMIVARAWPQFLGTHWLYAVLSLTVARMLPVAISLIGSRLSAATILFMGWFGPRGLASIVLGLVYLEMETHLPGEDTIRLTVMVTVFLSIFAHGLSALPGINFYARKIELLPANAPEHQNLEKKFATGQQTQHS